MMVCCDCCGGTEWDYCFTLNGLALSRCQSCGLHSVSPLPSADQRMTEMEEGRFSGNSVETAIEYWERGERVRAAEFARYVTLIERHAPKGSVLDVGCGAGGLMRAIQARGREMCGIELTPARRSAAVRATGSTIYDRPLEELNLAPGSVAAITMIDVFSHLIAPSVTLACAREVLADDGILILRTSEIAPGVQASHHVNWLLGDHLHFLGESTIERYADRLGFDLIHRERDWQPDLTYSREHLALRGPSAAKNIAKQAVTTVPGVLPALRWFMLNRQRANPMYASTLVLRKR